MRHEWGIVSMPRISHGDFRSVAVRADSMTPA